MSAIAEITQEPLTGLPAPLRQSADPANRIPDRVSVQV